MSLLRVLVKEMDMTASEARAEMAEARKLMMEYLDNDDQDGAYNICEEMWGLEPDYLIDLM